MVLGETLSPLGLSLLQAAVSLPRCVGAPREAVSNNLLKRHMEVWDWKGPCSKWRGEPLPWAKAEANSEAERSGRRPWHVASLTPSLPPCCPGLRAAWGLARSSPQLLGSLQRGNRRTRVLLNQGNDTQRRQPRAGSHSLSGLALIWSQAPGIPPAPSLEGSFSGLPLTMEITSFLFLFWAGGLAGPGGRAGAAADRITSR